MVLLRERSSSSILALPSSFQHLVPVESEYCRLLSRRTLTFKNVVLTRFCCGGTELRLIPVTFWLQAFTLTQASWIQNTSERCFRCPRLWRALFETGYYGHKNNLSVRKCTTNETWCSLIFDFTFFGLFSQSGPVILFASSGCFLCPLKWEFSIVNKI